MTDDARLLRAQASLTQRDLRLLGWLYDHGVLTTDQIAAALFPSLDFAQRRLLRLFGLGVLARFRPQKWDGGSHPYHYVLDQLGTEVVAAQRGDDPPRRDQARRRRHHLTSRANLPHLLGTNQFFIDLAAHERTHSGSRLDRWWPAAAFHSPGALFHKGDNPQLMVTHQKPRPDGHGIWTDGDQEAGFFLELDRGTEFSGGQSPCWSPDLRVCAAQRLIGQSYPSQQMWCKHIRGVSFGRGLMVHEGRRLSPPRGEATDRSTTLRAWCPCHGVCWGRCGPPARDRHPDRPSLLRKTAGCRRCAGTGIVLGETLRGLCCGGGARA